MCGAWMVVSSEVRTGPVCHGRVMVECMARFIESCCPTHICTCGNDVIIEGLLLFQLWLPRAGNFDVSSRHHRPRNHFPECNTTRTCYNLFHLAHQRWRE